MLRRTIFCSMVAMLSLPWLATPVQAHFFKNQKLVNSWYCRYLGRPVDHAGHRAYVHSLQEGVCPDVVESALLGNVEYYQRNRCTADGFVHALFRDVLCRPASIQELADWLNRLNRCGCCRQALALQFIQQYRVPCVVVSPPPITVVPPPVSISVLRPPMAPCLPRPVGPISIQVPGFSLYIGR